MSGCKRVERKAAALREPQVPATVYTIRTYLPKENRSTVHQLVVAGERARFTNEIDRWRLFDLKQRTVTFVDDVAKTFRTSTFDDLVAKKRAALRPQPDADSPRAALSAPGSTARIAGVDAKQYVVTVGGYRRELWISDNRSLPRDLFPLMIASEPPRGSHAAIMHDAFEAMLPLRGFLVAEHSKLDAGESTLEMDRRLEKIEQKNVAESLVTIPRDYRDVTPRAPAAGRPSAGSPQRGRSVPGAE